METYCIRRFYFNDERNGETIAIDLTLEEAQEHCQDPETSSRTCSEETDAVVDASGPWFDGYEEA